MILFKVNNRWFIKRNSILCRILMMIPIRTKLFYIMPARFGRDTDTFCELQRKVD